jgi:hypothetical protein
MASCVFVFCLLYSSPTPVKLDRVLALLIFESSGLLSSIEKHNLILPASLEKWNRGKYTLTPYLAIVSVRVSTFVSFASLVIP